MPHTQSGLAGGGAAVGARRPGQANGLVVGIVTVLTALFAAGSLCARLENQTLDWRFMQRGARPPRVPITIVQIDQDSLDDPALARPFVFWGTYHARVLSLLQTAGARAVGFDIYQPVLLANYADPNPDDAEARALARMPNVVLPYTRKALYSGLVREALPNPQLSIASELGGGRRGYANLGADPDGVNRRLVLQDDDGSPAFALAVAAIATGSEPRLRSGLLQLGNYRLALDSGRACAINYIGPSGTFPRISYRDLLAHPERYRAQIHDHICLVGVTDTDSQDYHQVPFSRGQGRWTENLMPGVEVHANVVHTILSDDGITRFGPWLSWCLLAVAGLLAFVLSRLLRVLYAVPALVVALVAWVYGCQAAFTHLGWQLPLVAPLTALIANQFLLTVVRLRQEGARARWVEEVFGRYVSQPVLDYLRASPEAVSLVGQRRDVTVLFCDVCGFTALSEQMEPEAVTQFLNRYLTLVAETILANGGTVDKYIGDAVMAVFNWPVGHPDHAARAVRAAVQIQQGLSAAASWPAVGEPLRLGIGIHSGAAIVGNIGSPRRMECTAVGDAVNVASRLEKLAKELGPTLGSQILISESTYSLLKAARGAVGYTILPAGQTALRGRQQALELHAIVVHGSLKEVN